MNRSPRGGIVIGEREGSAAVARLDGERNHAEAGYLGDLPVVAEAEKILAG